MNTAEIVFLISVIVVFYSYIGYGMLLFVLTWLKRKFHNPVNENTNDDFPEIALVIPAYNEKDYINQKVKNTRELNYPKDKIIQIWITDGSDDGTPEILKQFDDVVLYHENERKGKIAAMNRGMKMINAPITVFSDANTILSEDSLLEIAILFRNPKVGCVSGEKRILMSNAESAASSSLRKVM